MAKKETQGEKIERLAADKQAAMDAVAAGEAGAEARLTMATTLLNDALTEEG